jgi:hypothetical protein
MVYDFAAKIKNVQNTEALNPESLETIVSEINEKSPKVLELKFILPNADNLEEFLVKSQASISSMPALHEKELEQAIEAFIAYLKEIAKAIDGEISEQDGFYNNSKTFKRLFN